MPDRPEVSNLRFAASQKGEVVTGLLGWVRFRLDGRLQLDGVAVRRTRGGELALSFPARVDRHGRRHPYIRPLNDVTRKEIERQVFRQLVSCCRNGFTT